jgi:undecaprenyl pyrophosphate synthase
MKDQFNQFFKNTDFDIEEPRFGHLDRFEKRLNPQKKKKSFSYKWMSVAASIILVVGFWLGANVTDKTLVLADVSPEMQEAETFFVSTIKQELRTIENFRNPTTERVIEDALNQLERLEEKYQDLVKSLNKSNNDRRVVYAMISNYQSRIEILQDVLNQIDKIKKLKVNSNDEIYI